MFDDDVFGAESHKGLDDLIRVPDPKLVQLVSPVEGILDCGRDTGADPHVAGRGTVKIVHQTGAVDGVINDGKVE